MYKFNSKGDSFISSGRQSKEWGHLKVTNKIDLDEQNEYALENTNISSHVTIVSILILVFRRFIYADDENARQSVEDEGFNDEEISFS